MTEKFKMLLGGILSALGALALETTLWIFIDPYNLAKTSPTATWIMPAEVFIEELVALIIIRRLFQNSSDKNNLFSRALLFGVGFSIPEILLNFSNYPLLSQDIILSYLGLLLIHTATAGIFGYYFSRRPNRSLFIFFFFFLALFFHLLFNFAVMAAVATWMILGLPIGIILACFLALKFTLVKSSLPIQKN